MTFSRAVCIAAMCIPVFPCATAQTLATGDSRTVTEPVFPQTCTELTAQLQIVDGSPSTETAEDTTRIQAALNGCAAGQAVELTGSGQAWAYLIGAISIPAGVSLIVDGGVTVFASRNPADYQISGSSETCGSYGAAGNACKSILTVASSGANAASGIYGYGIIDGRGTSTLLTNGTTDTGISWYANADTAGTMGMHQDNPDLLFADAATNFTLYKITLRNSPLLHVIWAGNGFTAWGVKVQAPFTAHNTAGFGPSGTNMTINQSTISDGDDNVAVVAYSASSDITVENSTTYSGHGISIGSVTTGGLTNMLVKNISMAGTAADPNAIALRIKSAEDRGGLVQTVTYENICIRDTAMTLDLDPFYDTDTGSEYPDYSNIVFDNVHVLAPTSASLAYSAKFEGHDADHLSTVTLDNVTYDSALAQSNVANEYTAFTLMGNVYPGFLQSLGGTGVSYSGSATSDPTGTPACSPALVFPYLTGELFAQNSSATNQQRINVPAGTAVTMNAVVQPAMAQSAYSGTSGSWNGAPSLTQPVNFYAGETPVGSATLGANGSNNTLATLTLNGVPAGTYTVTAQYPGDANYAAFSFGSVQVTVVPLATATALSLSPNPVVSGQYVTLNAAVSHASGMQTPTGTVTFYAGTVKLATINVNSSGSAAVTASTAGYPPGTYNITAVYAGDSTYSGSVSPALSATLEKKITSTVLAVSPNPIPAGDTVTLRATVSDPGATGTVTFKANGLPLATVDVGSNGVAVLTQSSAGYRAGAYSVTAAYNGGTYDLGSTSAPVNVTLE